MKKDIEFENNNTEEEVESTRPKRMTPAEKKAWRRADRKRKEAEKEVEPVEIEEVKEEIEGEEEIETIEVEPVEKIEEVIEDQEQ